METTRQKILTQALGLFAQYGYEAVSAEQIAAAVAEKPRGFTSITRANGIVSTAFWRV